ncbi:helix-turn-helix domain-containing protein [Saccharomonospora halophila]|uniref:helix-turn-helix domain-containing protein n=1 Tax=Saccharomonospora halophila TaxID=129922 RepID=UPI000382B47D|nr:helix-turn-helix domain-containing protein [Saccharomonospora halophila]
MNNKVTFGAVLRRRREERGLSLRGLAGLICYSPGWLSKIENGLVRPTLPMAMLCDRELATGAEFATLAREFAQRDSESPTPAQLPRETDGFIGREREIEFLDTSYEGCDRIRRGMLATVEGNAGTGKTALALRWAHRVADRFDDGIMFAGLQGYSANARPLDPGQVLGEFLVALGVGEKNIPSRQEQRASLLRTLTARRRMLIILDDAASSSQVQPLLPSGHDCAVVVTSRRRLTGLTVRNKATSLTLRPMLARESGEVLRSFLGEADYDAKSGAFQRLARQCAHIPLALRIVGARLASTSLRVEHLVRDLADPETRLDLLSDAEDASLSMRTALERSYRDLDRQSARIFRVLGLSSPDTVPPLARVLSECPHRRAREALHRLADVHLIGDSDGGAYALDELTGAFAAEKARGENDRGCVATVKLLGATV